MVKYRYFETLEQLCALAENAVRLACGSVPRGRTDISALRKSCDQLICELENALFSDFLPPLERDSIAACAHGLSRVTDASEELLNHRPNGWLRNEEGEVCVALAEELTRSIALLRHLRKPEKSPDLQGFRALLSKGRQLHQAQLWGLRTGATPRSAAEAVLATGRLRGELSRCFDRVVEIMLNNI